MSEACKDWSDQDRTKQFYMFLRDVPVEEIAEKFGRSVAAIKQDKSAFKAFLRGKRHRSYDDSNFFRPLRYVILEILLKTL